MLERSKNLTESLRIGLVGKYVQLKDAYLSVHEAIQHASYFVSANTEIEWIDSNKLPLIIIKLNLII